MIAKLVFLVVIIQANAHKGGGGGRWLKQMKENSTACAQELGITEDQMKEPGFQDSKEKCCIHACMLEKKQWMENGQLTDTCKGAVEKMCQAWPDNCENITAIWNKCVDEANAADPDKCEVARKFKSCIGEKLPKYVHGGGGKWEKINENWKACRNEQGITEEMMKKPEFHSSKEANCLHACVFGKRGWMENGKLTDKCREPVQRICSAWPDKCDNATASWNNCMDEAENAGPDQCDVAGFLKSCVKDLFFNRKHNHRRNGGAQS